MAELTQLRIGNFTATNTVYTAGTNITIDNGVISAIGADLTNYYTKTEVDDLLDAIENARIEVVDELPATGETNVIYLVPKDPSGESGNIYDEYVYASGAFEKIGDTEIDLNNYYTKAEADAKYLTCANLADCQTFQTVVTEVAGKQDQLTAGDNITIAQDGTISATDTTYENATTSAAGLMSAADKEKLDGLTPDDYLTCDTVGECGIIAGMQLDIDALKNDKQDILTAGDGITIAPDVTGNTVISTTAPTTKAAVLALLGYEEVELSMTDANGTTVTKTILAQIEE